MRYTKYHAGKAVIKDKNKLSEAMEKFGETGRCLGKGQTWSVDSMQ